MPTESREASVCVLFVSARVVPIAIWAHSVPLCRLISPFLKSQAPLLSGGGFGRPPLPWHWDVSQKYKRVRVWESVWWIWWISFALKLEESITTRYHNNRLREIPLKIAQCPGIMTCCWESCVSQQQADIYIQMRHWSGLLLLFSSAPTPSCSRYLYLQVPKYSHLIGTLTETPTNETLKIWLKSCRRCHIRSCLRSPPQWSGFYFTYKPLHIYYHHPPPPRQRKKSLSICRPQLELKFQGVNSTTL